MYRNGKGVQQDFHKAMEYYLKAANQGHADAQCNIGIYSFIHYCDQLLKYIIDKVYCIMTVRGYNKITTKQWNTFSKQQTKEMYLLKITLVLTLFISIITHLPINIDQVSCIIMVRGYNRITTKQWNTSSKQQTKEMQLHNTTLVFTHSL